MNKEYLKKRNFNVFDSLEEISCKSDLILSSNVLEHIQDDLNTLRQMKKNLTDEGLIYLYLPAKISILTDLDEKLDIIEDMKLMRLEKSVNLVD